MAIKKILIKMSVNKVGILGKNRVSLGFSDKWEVERCREKEREMISKRENEKENFIALSPWILYVNILI